MGHDSENSGTDEIREVAGMDSPIGATGGADTLEGPSEPLIEVPTGRKYDSI